MCQASSPKIEESVQLLADVNLVIQTQQTFFGLQDTLKTS